MRCNHKHRGKEMTPMDIGRSYYIFTTLISSLEHLHVSQIFVTFPPPRLAKRLPTPSPQDISCLPLTCMFSVLIDNPLSLTLSQTQADTK